MAYVSTSNFDMYTSKAALLVQNIKEYSIIMKFANFLEGIFSSKYQIRVVVSIFTIMKTL